MAKNVMERYPDGGIKAACANEHDALDWALKDNFSSFPDYAGARRSPIIEPDTLVDVFQNKDTFLRESKKYMRNYSDQSNKLGELALE